MGKKLHTIWVDAGKESVELTSDNLDREIKGLTEAMRFFNLKQGLIVTLRESDKLRKYGYTIEVVPAHELLSNSL